MPFVNAQQPTISTPLDVLINDFHMADDLQIPSEPADDYDHIQLDNQIHPSSSDPVVFTRLTTEVSANRYIPAPSTSSSTVPNVSVIKFGNIRDLKIFIF